MGRKEQACLDDMFEDMTVRDQYNEALSKLCAECPRSGLRVCAHAACAMHWQHISRMIMCVFYSPSLSNGMKRRSDLHVCHRVVSPCVHGCDCVGGYTRNTQQANLRGVIMYALGCPGLQLPQCWFDLRGLDQLVAVLCVCV